jgi:hypothetical protein
LALQIQEVISMDGATSGDTAGTPGPEAMLSLLESEQARTAQALDPDPRVIYASWGAAWLVGFLLMWSAARGGRPLDLEMGQAGVLFAACLLGAIVTTVFHVVRRVAGVRGVSSRVGAMYGWAWFLSFSCLTVVMTGVRHAGAPDTTIGLLWSVLSGLLVGALYLAGGALWQDWVQYGLGAWILVASAAGALAGYPGVYLTMAVCGGGGFLLAAAFFTVRGRLGRA